MHQLRHEIDQLITNTLQSQHLVTPSFRGFPHNLTKVDMAENDPENVQPPCFYKLPDFWTAILAAWFKHCQGAVPPPRHGGSNGLHRPSHYSPPQYVSRLGDPHPHCPW